MSLPYETATAGDRAIAELQKTLAAFGCQAFGTMTDNERELLKQVCGALVASGAVVTIEPIADGRLYRASMLPNLSFPDSHIPEEAYGETPHEALRELDRDCELTLKFTAHV